VEEVVSFLLLAVCCLSLRELDHQLIRLNLDALNVSADESLVVNGVREFEMLTHRPNDQRLDFGCWYSSY
jgi:hypothetical protein